MHTENPFVHLHVHTQYSLLDGAIRLKELMKRVNEFEMSSVAITDHGTMFNVVEFYDKALSAGVKPVIGCECYVAPRTIADKTPLDNKGLSHLVLLAYNQEGYANLCSLASIAQLQGFYYKPRIDKKVLAEHSKGLIGLSACLHGEIPMLIENHKLSQAEDVARFYNDLFGEGNFYLEIQNNGISLQEKINQALLEMSRKLSIPLVATNDCHYLDKKDARAHEVLLCIQTGKTMNDADRFQFATDQLYFKSKKEMADYFKDYPGAIENTAAIAERCHVEFDFKTYHFPKFESDDGKSADELFKTATQEGFEKVFEIIKNKNPDADEKVYRDRLDYETSVIIDMGFPGYFLIVADFIRYAKENNVPVGPGRGSAAGSLVSYALGITDLDPIAHGLIFERFLNPARISMPDIDVDFCINGREEVFKYVSRKYGGGDYVAQIITFGKLKTRAVIRDVGRALDIPLRDVDAIAKMVPDVLNISLDDALKQEPRLTQLAEERPEIAELIEISRALEGLPRHASTHAAGVVIGDDRLVKYLPLYKGKNDEVVTQFDMKLVEKIGLVKFDFLGLRNLTVINNTLRLLAEKDITIDLPNIDLEDAKAYELLSRADTTGVFQLESSGMKDLLKRMKPACFDDITALVALYRPGPLDSGMVDDFVERKHGRKKVEYLVPELESILKETYGVIVYQEQVMKIAGVLASYSMAEADGLRKAMGKKIVEIMAQHRERFIEGSVTNNIPREKATNIFDLMEKFGGYGFNKSHSAAYALIAYQTAYLKAHYPVEFIASLLSSEMHSTDSVVKFIDECKTHDIEILPPDINESNKDFTVTGNAIRFGLLAVKNVGEGAIDAIVQGRIEKKYTSIFDFCERVDLKKVNKRVVESLIKCGAFDSTGARRSQMWTCMEEALDYGQSIQREKADPQMNLFDMGGGEPSINPPTLPDIEEWSENKRLALEKESLGFYVTGHPLNHHEHRMRKFGNADSLSLNDKNDGEAIRIGGVVRNVKVIQTKKGDPMAFVTLEDLKGSVEITIFSGEFLEVRDFLTDDTPIFVEGYIQKDEDSVKITANKVIPMDKAEETWTDGVKVNLDVSTTDEDKLKKLKSILAKHPGATRTYLMLREADKFEALISLPQTVEPDAKLFEEICRLAGGDAVEIIAKAPILYQRNKSNGFKNKRDAS